MIFALHINSKLFFLCFLLLFSTGFCFREVLQDAGIVRVPLVGTSMDEDANDSTPYVFKLYYNQFLVTEPTKWVANIVGASTNTYDEDHIMSIEVVGGSVRRNEMEISMSKVAGISYSEIFVSYFVSSIGNKGFQENSNF